MIATTLKQISKPDRILITLVVMYVGSSDTVTYTVAKEQLKDYKWHNIEERQYGHTE